ncbi:MAG: type II toxin-antitoxin system RelE/ParE family toxin [Kiritimatiellae bacterium]|nr:type II toxin-antitoxin system RelE/ParE family toxin [Kiritimatiellia bacterium]
MLGEKYTLDIRPTFIEELDRAAAYIELHLHNQMAADKLVVDVYNAIDRTLDHPLVTAPCYRPPDVNHPYYAIHVGNYTIYYIVHDHVMEVRWFRYSRSVRSLSPNPAYDTSSPYEE